MPERNAGPRSPAAQLAELGCHAGIVQALDVIQVLDPDMGRRLHESAISEMCERLDGNPQTIWGVLTLGPGGMRDVG